MNYDTTIKTLVIRIAMDPKTPEATYEQVMYAVEREVASGGLARRVKGGLFLPEAVEAAIDVEVV